MSARRLVVRYMGPGAVEWPLEAGITHVDLYWSREALEAATYPYAFQPGWMRPEAHRIAFDPDPLRRKFGAVQALFEEEGTRDFDAFLFADDDLAPRGCSITDVFDAFDRSGARIAHPGLTRDSFCSWAHMFVEEPARLAVPIDFTELQAPLFTREALVENLPEFGETVSCWGLERLWAKREREAGRDVVRLDTVPFFHGRDQTGALRSGVPAGDKYGMAEAKEFMKRHECETLPPLVKR